MKRSLLARLRSNGTFYIISALLLLLVIPLYQLFVLTPTGLNNALGSGQISAYLTWISSHRAQFIAYRLLLLIAFALLLTLPFSLYRIIVAQELMGQQEREEAALAESEDEDEDELPETNQDESAQEETTDGQEEEDEEEYEEVEDDGMPAFAWRGKGFAVLAVWLGMFGFGIYVLGTFVSTLYLAFIGVSASSSAGTLSSIFTIAVNTVGIALIALSTLFFGAMIVRSGRNLWPGSWIAFGAMAMLVTLLLVASAVEVAGSPAAGQSALTTPATWLFAIWVIWLGIMLVRLRPEAA